MECQICLNDFDHSRFKPFVLMPCGHTICNECIKQLTSTTITATCPNCQQRIQSTSPNWAFLNITPQSAYDKAKKQAESLLSQMELLHSHNQDSHAKKCELIQLNMNLIREKILNQTLEIVKTVYKSQRVLLDTSNKLEKKLSNKLASIFDERLDYDKYRLFLDENKLSPEELDLLNSQLHMQKNELAKTDQELTNFRHNEYVFIVNTSTKIDTNFIGSIINQKEAVKKVLSEKKYLKSLIESADSLIKRGELDVALEQLDKAINLDHKLHRAHFKKCLVLKLQNHLDRSFEYLSKLIALDQYDFASYNLMGDIKLERNECELAEKYYDLSLQIRANKNHLAYYGKGCLKYHLGHYAAAIKLFDVAIEHDVNYEMSYVKKAECYKQLALEFRARNSLYLGFFSYMKSLLDKAVLNYDKALAIKPSDYALIISKKEAINLIHVTQIDLQQVSALIDKACFAETQGQYGLAIEYLNKVLQIEPKCFIALYRKGHVLRAQKVYSESLKCLYKVIEYDMLYVLEAYVLVADIYLELNYDLHFARYLFISNFTLLSLIIVHIQ
jgi:tetratricopeptide (TPR) repeat protein